MGSTDTESASDCLELCKDVAGCEWFTFFERAGECLLTSSCGLVDYSCEGDCVYGKKSCYLADSGNNTEGKKVISLTNNPEFISIENLPVGNYILKITDTDSNVTQIQKVIKN